MLKVKRRQFFVDPKVQGTLVLRTAVYWAFCLLTVLLMLVCWRVWTQPAQPFMQHVMWVWAHYAPAMVAAGVLLPILLIDTVRVSNRFSGPMIRLRRSMQRMADGEPVARLCFRKEDFWRGFADDFNRIVDRLDWERDLRQGREEDFEPELLPLEHEPYDELTLAQEDDAALEQARPAF